MDKQNIFEAAKFLTEPHKNLAPEFFDAKNNLYQDVQADLLRAVGAFMTQTVDKLDGLEVEDICLTGSLASYYYHEKSDIDVIVLVTPTGNFWSNNEYALFSFLNIINNNTFCKFGLPTYRGRNLDIKLNNMRFNYDGKYSLKNNAWVRFPVRKPLPELTSQMLLERYFELAETIDAFLKQMMTEPNAFSVPQYRRFKHFMREIGVESLAEDNSNFKDYLAQKMMSYSGRVYDFDYIGNNLLKQALSLK